MTVGERLYELRKKYGYSQEDIADKLEVTRQTVSKWENNMTTPELTKAVMLCKLYSITVEYLMSEVEANNINDTESYQSENSSNQNQMNTHESIERVIVHEYKSKKSNRQYISKIKIGNIPLVHINYGTYDEKKKGNGVAKGIIAIGNLAIGVIAIGLLPIGLISIGVFAIGLICALGLFSVGVYSFGTFSVGMLAMGAISLGYVSIGAIAIGNYSIGAVAVANQIAIGAYANGLIAYGEDAVGQYAYLFEFNNHTEVLNAIQTHLPNTPKWVSKMFEFFLI